MATKAPKPAADLTTLGEAARSGDRRRTLETLRNHLADALDEGGPGVAAQIAGQLRQTLADIDALGEPDAPSAVDDLLARRRARRAGHGGSP